jgi:hypothetical protein
MVTPAHSEWRDHSNLVKTISGIVATPRLQIGRPLHLPPHGATYFPNDKRPPDDPDYNCRNR